MSTCCEARAGQPNPARLACEVRIIWHSLFTRFGTFGHCMRRPRRGRRAAAPVSAPHAEGAGTGRRCERFRRNRSGGFCSPRWRRDSWPSACSRFSSRGTAEGDRAAPKLHGHPRSPARRERGRRPDRPGPSQAPNAPSRTARCAPPVRTPTSPSHRPAQRRLRCPEPEQCHRPGHLRALFPDDQRPPPT